MGLLTQAWSSGPLSSDFSGTQAFPSKPVAAAPIAQRQSSRKDEKG